MHFIFGCILSLLFGRWCGSRWMADVQHFCPLCYVISPRRNNRNTSNCPNEEGSRILLTKYVSITSAPLLLLFNHLEYAEDFRPLFNGESLGELHEWGTWPTSSMRVATSSIPNAQIHFTFLLFGDRGDFPVGQHTFFPFEYTWFFSLSFYYSHSFIILQTHQRANKIKTLTLDLYMRVLHIIGSLFHRDVSHQREKQSRQFYDCFFSWHS